MPPQSVAPTTPPLGAGSLQTRVAVVETRETVGVYRTFWALLDLDDPGRILRLEDEQPVPEANPELTRPIARQMYLPTPVVFTTGAADAGDHYIVASGEADLACRISHMPKALFA